MDKDDKDDKDDNYKKSIFEANEKKKNNLEIDLEEFILNLKYIKNVFNIGFFNLDSLDCINKLVDKLLKEFIIVIY